jgi:hypothetical protein
MLSFANKPFMLSVVMLNAIMLSVFMLNVVMLSVVMLNVIMFSVVMVNVMAPLKYNTNIYKLIICIFVN